MSTLKSALTAIMPKYIRKQIDEIQETTRRLETEGHEFSCSSVPYELRDMRTLITKQLHKPGDDDAAINARFLEVINAHNGQGNIPNFYYDGIVLKMMYEFKNKYGKLKVPSSWKNFLSEAEVMRPLKASEKTKFRKFCETQSKGKDPSGWKNAYAAAEVKRTAIKAAAAQAKVGDKVILHLPYTPFDKPIREAPEVIVTSSGITVGLNTFSLDGVERVTHRTVYLREADDTKRAGGFWWGWFLVAIGIPLLALGVGVVVIALGLFFVVLSHKTQLQTFQIYLWKSNIEQLVYSDRLGSPNWMSWKGFGYTGEEMWTLEADFFVRRERAEFIVKALGTAIRKGK